MSGFGWRFEPLSTWGGATGDAWNNALAGSTLTEEERLAREAIQNSDDAHDDSLIASAVRIRISRRTIQGRQLQALVKTLDLDHGFKGRLAQLGLPLTTSFAEIISGDRKQLEVTVVEDYNTVGLGGALISTHDATQAMDHMAKLVYLFGGSDKVKGASSGGSFGYGKSTYSSLSDVKTVAYYSSFKPTKRSEGRSRRFIVSSLFEKHTFKDASYTGRAFIAKLNDDSPVPAVDGEADSLAESIGLSPRDLSSIGTSIVIFGTRLNMDRLREAIETHWWPKLVDQELTVELYDGEKELEAPAPKARQDLKPFLTCYEIITKRQNADRSKGEKRGQIGTQTTKYGDWAGVRWDGVKVDDELDENRSNKVALVRSSKMVIEYNSNVALSGAQVAIAGVFVADEKVDSLLRLSEPPAHNVWDKASDRLNDDEKGEVGNILQRLKGAVRAFHRELQPAPPPSTGRLKVLEDLLGKMLQGSTGFEPPTPSGPDPYKITHKLKRKMSGNAVRLSGTVRIELQEEAKVPNLLIEYRPSIEILEDETLSSGDPLGILILRVKSGNAKVSGDPVNRLITATISKKSPLELHLESTDTNPDWALAYRETISAEDVEI